MHGVCGQNKSLLGLASGGAWKRIGTDKRSGMVVPLFSVFSGKSCGIGDFDDLHVLIDLCVKTGNSILQLLPMNEVGGTCCPYDSVSAFALEPAYISFRSLTTVPPAIKEKIEALASEFRLEGKKYVDYRIKARKMALLWEVFNSFKTVSSREFERFQADNVYWLDDFAAFQIIKGCNAGKPWWEWDEKLRRRDPQALAAFSEGHIREMVFQKWLQWQLCRQFKEAKKYADAKKVLIKGDLPILVSRDSADVWAHTELFKLEFDAGAPPDMYCAKGQRWGTPTYNWQRIFDEGGGYLKAKLAYAGNFYELLRIDHVVGLFRIWSIPVSEPEENYGLNGFFDPGDESRWEEHGRRILLFILQNSRLFLCAEDLGVIPPQCTRVLAELGIPGNDVQRWTKDWSSRHDFLPPDEFRFLSATMLSTHDTTNWPAWWQYEAGTIDEALFDRKCASRGIDATAVKAKLFDPLLSQHGRLRWRDSLCSVDILCSMLGRRREDLADFIDLYLNSFGEKEKLWKELEMVGPMREESDAELVEAITCRTLASSSIFFLNLLTDWLYLGDIIAGDPYVHRINLPGTIRDTNWSLLVPASLEQIIEHPVCEEIHSLVEESARTCHQGHG
jgi:4-alpha-glucanotransferase